MVRCLLDYGADTNDADASGSTPLYYAACKGHLELTQCLLEHGVDVNKVAVGHQSSRTPLHIAVENGHIEVAVCLIESGLADVDATTKGGQKPIDLAPNEEVRLAIVNAVSRRFDHGLMRAVLPNPTDAERANGYLACLGGQNEVQGQGQASANAVAEENDDDSGSDEPHEVAYRESLKRHRTK